MSKHRRLRVAVPAKHPGPAAPEGQRAAWYRQEHLRLSRPALGERINLTPGTIARYEGMSKVPELYRLAIAALSADLRFDWHQVKATIGNSVVTFTKDSGRE